MKIPTHIVIDMQDGYVFAKDADGNLFTQRTAQRFVDTRNDKMTDEYYRTYIVAEVIPQRSPEYLVMLAQSTRTSDHVAMIENMEARDMRGD